MSTIKELQERLHELEDTRDELLEALRGLMTCRCGKPGGPEVAPGTCCPHWATAEDVILKACGGEEK